MSDVCRNFLSLFYSMDWGQAIADKPWPSNKLSRDAVIKHLRMLWDQFFSPHAAMEIW